MARTAAEVLTALKGIVPPPFWGDDAWLAGVAAMFQRAEQLVDALATAGLVDGATAEWLDLHGFGLGLRRANGESDGSFRTRCHTITGRVTRAAITTAVDGILAASGSTARCILREYWCDGLFFDCFESLDETAEAATDTLSFLDVPNVFGVGVSTPGDVTTQDITYAFEVTIPAGLDALHPPILAAIESTRAAGVTGFLAWAP